MAGYFNDGNGVKNITDGYFYDGDVKYYKDVVTTKYWKEVTTESRELEYACYRYLYSGGFTDYLIKTPLGSDKTIYYADLSNNNAKCLSISEENIDVGMIGAVPRYRDGDLYKVTTVTETVEGTPEDYTHTTTETTTVEVSADDEYDYKEYYPKKIKQIYKVINGEAKLIFNNE